MLRKLNLKPLYLLPENFDESIFERVEFDATTRELINKSFYGTRHAVIGWVPRDAEDKNTILNSPSTLISRSRPSLLHSSSEENILAAEKQYGSRDHFVLAAESGASGTGVVHFQTILQIEKNEPALVNFRNSLFRYIAFSFTVKGDVGKPELDWTNRSSQNMSLFARDDLALACLTFSPNTTNLSHHHEYTLAYHLNRSIPKKVLDTYIKSAEKNLNIPCTYNPKKCYSIQMEKFWDDIVAINDPEVQEKTVKELLMTNIYLASSLPPAPDKASQTSKKNGYEKDLRNIFEVARKYGITIDPDFIPQKFMEYSNHSTPLIMAVKNGYVRTTQLLLENNASLNSKDKNGNTPLSLALQKGHYEIADLIVKKRSLSPEKITLSELALNFYNKKLQEEFNKLNLTPQVEMTTSSPESMKLLATILDDLKPLLLDPSTKNYTHFLERITEYHLSAKTLPDHTNAEKLLNFANHIAMKINTNMITRFIEDGNEISLQKHITIQQTHPVQLQNVLTLQNRDGYTPAYLAAKHGKIDTLRILANNNVDLNEGNHEGRTPAHVASMYDQLSALQYLSTELSVDLNKQDHFGNTPAHGAASNGNIRVLEFLANQTDIDLNKENHHGETPAHLAANAGEVEALKFLVTQSKTTLGKVNKQGDTLAHAAAKNGHVEVLRFLASHPDASFEKENNSGHNLAYVAAENGQVDVLNFLSTHSNIPFNEANKTVSSLAYAAAKNGHVDVLRYLVGNDVELHEVNHQDDTLVNIAIKNGQLDTLRYLTEQPGINLNKANNNGETPADLASKAGNTAALHILNGTRCDLIKVSQSPIKFSSIKNLLRNKDAILSHREALYYVNINNETINRIDYNKSNSKAYESIVSSFVNLYTDVSKEASAEQIEHIILAIGHDPHILVPEVKKPELVDLTSPETPEYYYSETEPPTEELQVATEGISTPKPAATSTTLLFNLLGKPQANIESNTLANSETPPIKEPSQKSAETVKTEESIIETPKFRR